MAFPSSWTGMYEKSSVGSDIAGTKTNPAHTQSSARACRFLPFVATANLSVDIFDNCFIIYAFVKTVFFSPLIVGGDLLFIWAYLFMAVSFSGR